MNHILLDSPWSESFIHKKIFRPTYPQLATPCHGVGVLFSSFFGDCSPPGSLPASIHQSIELDKRSRLTYVLPRSGRGLPRYGHPNSTTFFNIFFIFSKKPEKFLSLVITFALVDLKPQNLVHFVQLHVPFQMM